MFAIQDGIIGGIIPHHRRDSADQCGSQKERITHLRDVPVPMLKVKGLIGVDKPIANCVADPQQKRARERIGNKCGRDGDDDVEAHKTRQK